MVSSLMREDQVIELRLVGDDVGVRACSRDEVVVADELADPRPGHPAEVEQRDAAVAQVVRAEHRYAGSGAGTGNRGAEAIAAEALEDRALRDAILACHEPPDGLEEHVGHRNPARPSGLRDRTRDAPALPRFTNVAPGQALEFADSHSGCVEQERGQPVASGEQAHDGFDVGSGRRVQFPPFFARQPDRQSIAPGVRLDAAVVEDHRRDRERLANRLLLQAGGVELADEVGHGLRVDAVDRLVAETGEKPTERDAVGLRAAPRGRRALPRLPDDRPARLQPAGDSRARLPGRARALYLRRT
jgi:hypothetical protein